MTAPSALPFPPAPAARDPRRCPRCGQANACTQAEGAAPDAPCWCRSVPVAERPRGADATQATACDCATCLAGLGPLPTDP